MTYNTTFSCSVGTTDPSGQIGLEIWMDKQQIFNSDLITETELVEYSFPEDEAEHELRFIVKNKINIVIKIPRIIWFGWNEHIICLII